MLDVNDASFDFFSPFCKCWIVTEEGKSIPLWMSGGMTEQEKTDTKATTELESVPYVSSVSVHSQMGGMTDVTITINAPYREAISLLNSKFLNWARVGLYVVLGYTGSKTVVSQPFTGIMWKPQVTFGPAVTIVFTSKVNHTLYSGESNMMIDGITNYRDLLKKLITKGGRQSLSPGDPAQVAPSYQFEPLSVDFSAIDRADQLDIAMWYEGISEFHVVNRTDWDCILYVVQSRKCWCYIENTVLKVVPYSILGKQGAAKIFRLMDFSGGQIGNGEYPILSLSINNDSGNLLPGVIEEVDSASINADKDSPGIVFRRNVPVSPIVGGIQDLKLNSPASGFSKPNGGGSLAASLIDPKDLKFLAPSATSLDSFAKSQSKIYPTSFALMSDNVEWDQEKGFVLTETAAIIEHKFITDQLGITASLETIGLPTISPGEVVHVSGCSVRVDGNYWVKDITHNYSTSGFTTSLTLITNQIKQDSGLQDADSSGISVNHIIEPQSLGTTKTAKIESLQDAKSGSRTEPNL